MMASEVFIVENGGPSCIRIQESNANFVDRMQSG